MKKRALILLGAAPLAWAQHGLSLREAVGIGLRENKSLAAADAAGGAAAARVREARAGMLPKVGYTESATRGDNPVYVFGSLLTQHQFGQANFALGPLNRPDALGNFQSLATVSQPVYDGGVARGRIRSAQLAQELTGEEARRARMETIAGVARAYYAVVLAAERVKSAEEAVRSAEADLERARTVLAAGMATDMDVLSIKVHLAAVREEKIRRGADLDVARAALNDAMGRPLDEAHTLTTGLSGAAGMARDLAAMERSGAERRPEARETKLSESLAEAENRVARGALRPSVSVRAALEADRQTFVTRGGANWLASVEVHWNAFSGFEDRAKITETGALVKQAQAVGARVDSAVRLEVRRAFADFTAAGERIEAARAAVEESEESLRIGKNRYEAGLSNVTDLLRNETAVLETKTRYLAAVHDQRVAAVMLDYAAGTLGPDSEVLR